MATSAAVDPSEVRALIEALIDAHVDGTRLAKRLMLLSEVSDAAQALAWAAYDEALNAIGDGDAVDRAVLTGSAASRANEDELEATVAWREHLEMTDRLIESARRVLEAL